MKRMLTGLQPSGKLTIANYIGGIKPMILNQGKYDSFLFIPDLHTITVPQDATILKHNIKNAIAIYLACGIDPQKNTIYLQSDNLYHANLSWILECNTSMGQLSRMTQYKDKIQRGKPAVCGLFTYPVLMAADILLYSADIVPTGADQKQHLELARDLAINFNNKYGKTFVIPEPYIPEIGAKIMDLQNPEIKMSKSAENPKGVIYLTDDEQTVLKKIKSAVTDSEAVVKYDVENKPGISNLITIYSCLSGLSIKDIEQKFGNENYGVFKTEVAKLISQTLTPIQQKYEIYKNDENMIKDILQKGLDVTNNIAKEKYNEVKQKVGLGLHFD